MTINLNEAISIIKQAGASKIRVVPMPGKPFNGDSYRIEVLQEGWVPLLENLPKSTAEDLVSKALNKVIMG